MPTNALHLACLGKDWPEAQRLVKGAPLEVWEALHRAARAGGRAVAD
eukprot:COSAG04_NODE_31209_length_258_cov_0.647799_1_plen_46_part_10